MLSLTKLIEERDTKRLAFCDKYEKKYALKKEQERVNNQVLLEEYSKSHSDEESKRYQKNLEEDSILKLNKLWRRYEKKIARYYRRTEIAKKIQRSNRIWEIDYLRGFAIWGMVVDHFLFNFYDLYEYFFDGFMNGWTGKVHMFSLDYWESDIRVAFRLIGVGLFVFLCGVSAHLSKNNYKRALGLIGVGGFITLFSYIFGKILDDPSWNIFIATLTGIGLCLLIYSLCETLFKLAFNKKYWKWVSLGLAAVLLVGWGITISKIYLGNENTKADLANRFFFLFNANGADITTYAGHQFSLRSNGWTYAGFKIINKDNWYRFLLGIEGFGSDWLGLFPYVGYIFLGGFVGETLYADKKSFIKFFYPKEQRLLTGEEYFVSPLGQMNAKINHILGGVTYPGSHTLLVYVAHQPVIILIMSIIFMICGYKLNLGDGLSSLV
ncbi:MAG: DUF1624 domain-containing protein [Bacilli bacterium]|nr:DUF1624 domain-containing protein [Bacilli bacterium]